MSHQARIEPLIRRIADARSRRREILRRQGDTSEIDAEGRAATMELGRAVYAINPQLVLWLNELDKRELARPPLAAFTSGSPPLRQADMGTFSGLAHAVTQLGKRLTLLGRLMRGTTVPALRNAERRQASELVQSAIAECHRIEAACADTFPANNPAASSAASVLPVNRFDALLPMGAGPGASHTDGQRQSP